jgi:hypothetical protein
MRFPRVGHTTKVMGNCLLTASSMDDMCVVGDLAGLDEGINALETCSRLAYHAPEGVGGARQEGDGGGDLRKRLHGCSAGGLACAGGVGECDEERNEAEVADIRRCREVNGVVCRDQNIDFSLDRYRTFWRANEGLREAGSGVEEAKGGCVEW